MAWSTPLTEPNTGACIMHQATGQTMGTSSRSNEVYQPLDSTLLEIRLLELQPGSDDEPVHGMLRKVSLHEEHWPDSQRPEYETISYVWGDATKRGSVYLSDIDTDVPASAEEVLKRVRSFSEVRVIWIDALCIDQQNLTERGEQVALMDEIFKNGVRNLVFLGQDDGYTAQALTDIRLIIDDMIRGVGEINKADEINRADDADGGLYRPDGVPPPGTSFQAKIQDSTALEHLYSSPWFSRLWVVQEVVLAQENLCIRGEFEVPLELVTLAATWTWAAHAREPVSALSKAAINAMYGAYQIGRLTGARGKFYSFGPELEGATGVITAIARFRVTDPRDSVYGTLGLIRDLSSEGEVPEALKPDYRLSTLEVFRNAVRYMLLETDHLEILSLSDYGGKTSGDEWPSWVPHSFDLKDPTRALPLLPADFEAGVLTPMDKELLSSETPNILSLNGLVVSRVDKISAGMDWPLDTEIEESILQVVKAGQEIQDADNEEAVAYAAVARPHLDAERLDSNIDCPAGWRACRQYVHAGNTPQDGTTTFERIEIEGLGKTYATKARDICRHRRFFTTSEPKLTGLGPETMRAGDILAVLNGGLTPFILRPMSSENESGSQCHHLVGECYIKGIMYFEVEGMSEEWGLREEIFHLQ